MTGNMLPPPDYNAQPDTLPLIAAPVQAQPMMAQPMPGQPMMAQPMPGQPVQQPMMAQPMQQPMMAQPMMAQPMQQPMQQPMMAMAVAAPMAMAVAVPVQGDSEKEKAKKKKKRKKKDVDSAKQMFGFCSGGTLLLCLVALLLTAMGVGSTGGMSDTYTAIHVVQDVLMVAAVAVGVYSVFNSTKASVMLADKCTKCTFVVSMILGLIALIVLYTSMTDVPWLVWLVMPFAAATACVGPILCCGCYFYLLKDYRDAVLGYEKAKDAANANDA